MDPSSRLQRLSPRFGRVGWVVLLLSVGVAVVTGAAVAVQLASSANGEMHRSRNAPAHTNTSSTFVSWSVPRAGPERTSSHP